MEENYIRNGIKTKFRPGFFEIRIGGMFSGKSTSLIRIGENMEKYGTRRVYYYKPIIDTRGQQEIISHTGLRKNCVYFKQASEIVNYLSHTIPSLIIIDEAQFADEDLIYVINSLRYKHHVIVGGIHLDFRGMPFGIMPKLMAIADEIHMMEYGYCNDITCDNVGNLPQRLRDGVPAHASEETILVDGEDENVTYLPMCRDHHRVPGLDEYMLERMPWTEVTFTQTSNMVVFTVNIQIMTQPVPAGSIVHKVMVKYINKLAKIDIVIVGVTPVENITVRLTVS